MNKPYQSYFIDHTWTMLWMHNPNQEISTSSKSPNKDLNDMEVLCTFKINVESLNFLQGRGPSTLKDYIQIMIKMQNSNDEPQAPTQKPIQDWKDIEVLCTLKINLESQN